MSGFGSIVAIERSETLPTSVGVGTGMGGTETSMKYRDDSGFVDREVSVDETSKDQYLLLFTALCGLWYFTSLEAGSASIVKLGTSIKNRFPLLSFLENAPIEELVNLPAGLPTNHNI